MKGILSIEGQSTTFVLQGVHELWDLQPGAAWKKGETRVSKIIFIGRNLDRAALKQEVEGWVVGTDRQRVFRSALEDLWAEEDEDYIEAVQAYAPQISAIEYEVTVHNGINGMGLVFTELSTGGIFVTKFVPFQKPYVNTAFESGKICLGDQLIGLQGHDVEGCTLNQLVSVVRRFRRGEGASGDDIVLQFRREGGGYERQTYFRSIAPPAADLPLAPLENESAASAATGAVTQPASAAAATSAAAAAAAAADTTPPSKRKKLGATGDDADSKKQRYGC